jgi:deoxyribodipyrimidine photo-lyase
VTGTVRAALADGLDRAGRHFGAAARVLEPGEVAHWIAAQDLPVVTPWAPVGWTADALRGLRLHRLRRDWDSACWPLATKGFFPFRQAIPRLIRESPPAPPPQPDWASRR